MAGPFTCVFNWSCPKSIEFMSIATSTVPSLLSRSRTTVPLVLLNLPRQTESPPLWSASKLGKVWLGSIVYLTGTAATAPTADASATKAVSFGRESVFMVLDGWSECDLFARHEGQPEPDPDFVVEDAGVLPFALADIEGH